MTNRSNRGLQEPVTVERLRTRGHDLGGNPQISSGPGAMLRKKAVHMTAPDRCPTAKNPLQRRRRPHMTVIFGAGHLKTARARYFGGGLDFRYGKPLPMFGSSAQIDGSKPAGSPD